MADTSVDKQVKEALKDQAGLKPHQVQVVSARNVQVAEGAVAFQQATIAKTTHQMERNSAAIKEARNSFRFEGKKVILSKSVQSGTFKVKAASMRNILSQKKVKADSYFKKKIDTAKAVLSERKIDLKVAKKVHQLNKRNAGDSKMVKTGKTLVRGAVGFSEAMMKGTEVGGDFVNLKYKTEQTYHAGKTAYKIGRGTAKGTYRTVKGAYGVSKRGANYAVKGTKRVGKVAAKNAAKEMRNFRNRLKNLQQSLKASWKAVQVASKALYSAAIAVLGNPITWFVAALAAVLLLIIMVFTAFSSPVTQTEFDTNDAWLHMTLKDREKSDDSVDYWSDIDGVMSFMGYRFGEWTLKDKVEEQVVLFINWADTGEKTLDKIWESLNGDTSDLKTVEYLYTEDEDWKLDTDDLEEYQEILQNVSEVGKYSTSGELDNPFYLESEDSYEKPIVIASRFGYTSTSDTQNYSVLKANMGQVLYAVMDGTVELKEDGKDGEATLYDVTITSKDKKDKFIYDDVKNVSVEDGDEVKVQTAIAKVASTDGQKVTYKKKHEDPDGKKDKDGKVKQIWTDLNVGFYFQSVEYTQTTSVISNASIDSDSVSRAKILVNTIKQTYPNATNKALAAILGCFDIESSITAKRYETDYLVPNKFDALAKDPTVETLVGDWASFQALYPTYQLMEETYLVSGKHYLGIGLGQWTGGRTVALKSFAESKKKSIWSLDLQVDFMVNGDYPYYTQLVKNITSSTDSVSTLTSQFLANWEGVPGNKEAERIASAEQWYKWLENGMELNSGGSGVAAASWDFPSEYKGKLKYGQPSSATMTTLLGNNYPIGQCTWYVANRLIEIGLGNVALSSNNGNGQDWVRNLVAKGWTYSSTPVVGGVMSEAGGAYGHVAFVEYVNADGSFLISECNYYNVQDKVHYRVISGVSSNQTFAYYKK